MTTSGEKVVFGMKGMTAEQTPMRTSATCCSRMRLTHAKSAIFPNKTRLMPAKQIFLASFARSGNSESETTIRKTEK